MATTIEEKIAVMQAFVDGKLIEFSYDGDHWRAITDPSWDWENVEYRVAKLTGTFLEVVTALREGRISKGKNSKGLVISVYNGKFITVANGCLEMDDYLDKWTEC
jgi:hypothetical protein